MSDLERAVEPRSIEDFEQRMNEWKQGYDLSWNEMAHVRLPAAIERAEAAEQALVLANQDAEGWRKDAERLAAVARRIIVNVRSEWRPQQTPVDNGGTAALVGALAAHDTRVAQQEGTVDG